MTHPDHQLFDFNAPIGEGEQPFADFVKEAETTSQGTRFHRHGAGALKSLLMAVLALNVVGIGVFGYLYLDRTEGRQALEGQVAGVRDVAETVVEESGITLGQSAAGANVVSGSGYSVVSPEAIPEGYKQTSERVNLPYLDNRSASLSRYLIDDTQTGERIRTGFEITRTEYDNALTRAEFAEVILSELGQATHVVAEEAVTLPKNIQATVIESTTNPDVYHYIVTTPSNYYVIKVYNETRGNDTLLAYTEFVESLPETLYLN